MHSSTISGNKTHVLCQYSLNKVIKKLKISLINFSSFLNFVTCADNPLAVQVN